MSASIRKPSEWSIHVPILIAFIRAASFVLFSFLNAGTEVQPTPHHFQL